MSDKKKMRVTSHNGRHGKNGVYSPKHNDRRFPIENAEHIDQDRMMDNRYWHCYATNDPDLSFEEVEKRFYEEHFTAALEDRNERNIRSRHPERVITMDDYRTAKRSCPEETLLQIGHRMQTVDADTLLDIAGEYLDWETETFPNCHVLDVALHVDEQGAPHMHERKVWIAHDKAGREIVGQSKALEEMGVLPPEPDKKRGRHNNAKMTYSAACRAKFAEICQNHGLEIESMPREASKSGLSLLEYKTQQEEASYMALKGAQADLSLNIAESEENLDKTKKALKIESERLQGLESDIGELEEVKGFCVRALEKLDDYGGRKQAVEKYRQDIETYLEKYGDSRNPDVIKFDDIEEKWITLKPLDIDTRQTNTLIFGQACVACDEDGNLISWNGIAPGLEKSDMDGELRPCFLYNIKENKVLETDKMLYLRYGGAGGVTRDDAWGSTFKPDNRDLLPISRRESLSESINTTLDRIERLQKRQQPESEIDNGYYVGMGMGMGL